MVEQGTKQERAFWTIARGHRRLNEVSQEDAAAMLGLNQPELSRRESAGGKTPTRQAVISFSKQLGLDRIDSEVLLASGGFAWSIGFYRALLDALEDRGNMNTDFRFGEMEVILERSLKLLDKTSSV